MYPFGRERDASCPSERERDQNTRPAAALDHAFLATSSYKATVTNRAAA